MLKKSTIWLIRIYQHFISPGLGKNCRFYPSCSQYSLQAIEKYGMIVGFWLALKRIFRCHPWQLGAWICRKQIF